MECLTERLYQHFIDPRLNGRQRWRKADTRIADRQGLTCLTTHKHPECLAVLSPHGHIRIILVTAMSFYYIERTTHSVGRPIFHCIVELPDDPLLRPLPTLSLHSQSVSLTAHSIPYSPPHPPPPVRRRTSSPPTPLPQSEHHGLPPFLR
jgi:hypothetical protein